MKTALAVLMIVLVGSGPPRADDPPAARFIGSKVATNRQKDRASLPRLESFRLYLRLKGRG